MTIRRACPVPTRSKKQGTLRFCPCFFRCFGVDIRADRLAPRRQGEGAKRRPRMKGKSGKDNGKTEGRTYQFPVGKLRAPCRGQRQSLRFRGSPRGLGQRPVMELATRWPHRVETNRFRKKAPCATGARGLFPSHSPAKRSTAARDPSRRGQYSPPEPKTFVLPSPPRRGRRRRRRGAPLPHGVPCPHPGRGGGRWGASALTGPRGQIGAAAAPLSLDKTLK